MRRTFASRLFFDGRTFALAAWVFLGLLCGGGCGLDDYEARMKSAQQQVEDFDKLVSAEEKFLGEPLKMPRVLSKKTTDKETTDEEVDVFRIFLRPPRGIENKSEGKRGILYHYKGSEGILALDVGAADGSKKIPADFKTQVCRQMGILGRKSGQEKKDLPGGRKLEFDTIFDKESDPAVLLYLYRGGPEQLAFVFQVSRKQVNDVLILNAIDASLKTLATGQRADDLASAYRRDDKVLYYRLRMQSHP